MQMRNISKRFLSFLVIALSIFLTSCSTSSVCDKTCDSDIRIGVYDSRSIAIAFMDSEIYGQTDAAKLRQWMSEYKTAKNENNKQKIKELESKGESLQEKRHKQGFGTAPVDDILAHIPDKTSTIKQQNNLNFLVSKWDIEALRKYGAAHKVDVTSNLIEAFGPTDQQRERAVGIQKYDPIRP